MFSFSSWVAYIMTDGRLSVWVFVLGMTMDFILVVMGIYK